MVVIIVIVVVVVVMMSLGVDRLPHGKRLKEEILGIVTFIW